MAWALLAGLFLPLFPLSMIFNGVLRKIRNPLARFALVLLWPQLGIAIITYAGVAIPAAWAPWAILTAALYAVRLLTVNDLALWAGFAATSALALVWVAAAPNDVWALHMVALAFSLPAGLLLWLARPLERQFGAAYAGLTGGLAQPMPRWSSALTLSTLAAIATPPFPGFFALLKALGRVDFAGVAAVLAIWLVWGWAATRLWQGFIFGSPMRTGTDIGRLPVAALVGGLVLLIAVGFYVLGGRL